MREVDDLRALGDLRPERLDDLLVRGHRQGDVGALDDRAARFLQELPGQLAGAVLVVGGDDLVARLELIDRTTTLTPAVALST